MESWNAEAAVKLIDDYHVVGTVAATPFLQEMVNVAVATGKQLPSLISFACGGAAVPPEIVQTANSKLANSFAFRVFGSSEVPLVTLGYQGAAQAELAATTDGEIIDYEVRIVDDAGRDVPQGQDGEIWARGPAMMLGYADPEDTKEAISEDGFFKTGDIGFISPEGALVISGRKKDLIIRGGENISAKEIEDVLHQSDLIREAAVVAMPHARLGEGICAFVIVKDAACRTEDLLAHVARYGLAKQKTPERFVFVEDFPRTASGKIRKDQLRIIIREMMEQEG
jgi:acyl-CoA synthetase (AMP-forming)/AMP-acid ligase II